MQPARSVQLTEKCSCLRASWFKRSLSPASCIVLALVASRFGASRRARLWQPALALLSRMDVMASALRARAAFENSGRAAIASETLAALVVAAGHAGRSRL